VLRTGFVAREILVPVDEDELAVIARELDIAAHVVANDHAEALGYD